MRKVASTLFALTLLGAGSAVAQDGGATDGGPAPTDAGPGDVDAGPGDTDAGPVGACNGLTLQGECQGSLVRYCATDPNTGEEQVVEYDCEGRFPNSTSTCGEVSAEWGFDCLIDSGQECSYGDGQGGVATTFCANEGACISDGVAQTSECVDTAGLDCDADPNTGAALNASCLGTAALYGCGATGTYIGLECSSGSTCNAGACEGTGVGGVCADGIATCADGLTCLNNECTEGGGEPEGTPEGGEPDAEPNSREPEPAPEPEDEPACSSAHSTTTGVPAGLAIIALLGAVAMRRRRR